jgi:hypothetical protein
MLTLFCFCCCPVFFCSLPSAFYSTLLSRLWEISRPLVSTTLLALGHALATRNGGNELEQLRSSFECVSRVVALTAPLPGSSVALLSSPTPQLTLEVAVYVAQASANIFLNLLLSMSSHTLHVLPTLCRLQLMSSSASSLSFRLRGARPLMARDRPRDSDLRLGLTQAWTRRLQTRPTKLPPLLSAS